MDNIILRGVAKDEKNIVHRHNRHRIPVGTTRTRGRNQKNGVFAFVVGRSNSYYKSKTEFYELSEALTSFQRKTKLARTWKALRMVGRKHCHHTRNKKINELEAVFENLKKDRCHASCQKCDTIWLRYHLLKVRLLLNTEGIELIVICQHRTLKMKQNPFGS